MRICISEASLPLASALSMQLLFPAALFRKC